MLIPSLPLVILSILLLPTALIGGLFPQALPVAGALYGALGLVTLIDAGLAWRRRGHLRVTVTPVTRTSRTSMAQVSLTLETDRTPPSHLLLGLEWPASLEAESPLQRILWPADNPACRVTWSFVAHERGVYPWQRARWESPSPWRLWRLREVAALEGEVRVYPDLSQDRGRLAHWFLPQTQSGLHAQHWLGKGHEFEKLREYQPGDGFEDIHWKATARHQKPITKQFQIERTQEVYLVLDTSRLSGQTLMDESTGASRAGTQALERYVTCASLLSMVCNRQGDLFGLITFSDQVHRFIRASQGRPHQQACQRILCEAQTRRVMPDYHEAFTFMRTRLHRRSLILLLTDLRDPVQAEECQRGPASADGPARGADRSTRGPGHRPTLWTS